MADKSKKCIKHPGGEFYSGGQCKSCTKERAAARYQAKSEEIKLKVKEYQINNKESVAETHKIYRQNNLEKVHQRQKDWYQANREEVIERNSAYREEHKDHLLEIQRKKWWENREENLIKHNEWRKDNLEELYSKKKLYYNTAKKEAMCHYSDGMMKCLQCSESRLSALALDHIKDGGMEHRRQEPRTRGHSVYVWARINRYPAIFQVLCHNCNFLKTLGPVKNEINKRHQVKLKTEVMSHYSGNPVPFCNECKIEDLRILTIDHIDGGGRKELLALEMKGGGGFYRHLRNSDYPKGYQVLCFSCNQSKHINESDDGAEL